MKDMILVGALVLACAIFITVHVTIAFGLLRRHPRWRAPLAFVIAPLAPIFAWREHMRIRAGLWTGALVLYVVVRILASRGG